MCILCIEFQKGKLSLEEAYHNWEEMNSDDNHSQEVLDMLNEALYDKVSDSNESSYEMRHDTESIDASFWYDDSELWMDFMPE